MLAEDIKIQCPLPCSELKEASTSECSPHVSVPSHGSGFGAPRFGELSDYVYCTYCAALLLERMDRDRKERRHTRGGGAKQREKGEEEHGERVLPMKKGVSRWDGGFRHHG